MGYIKSTHENGPMVELEVRTSAMFSQRVLKIRSLVYIHVASSPASVASSSSSSSSGVSYVVIATLEQLTPEHSLQAVEHSNPCFLHVHCDDSQFVKVVHAHRIVFNNSVGAAC